MTSLRTFRAALAIISMAALYGCGGSGDSADQPPAGQTGAVGIILTDAPTTAWDRALATITRITLLSDNGPPVEIFAGEETVDLLELGSYSEVFHIAEGVPVGNYGKIRLQVSGIELQRLDGAGEVAESRDAKLVANGKIDLNPRGGFTVVGDQTLMVQLDFDMSKSLKITEAGASGLIIVRPVVFVRILGVEALQRFTRVHGTVRELTTDGFVICQTRLVASDGVTPRLRHCLDVVLDDEAGLFDPAADPTGRDAIQPELELTAIGRLYRLGPAVRHSARHERHVPDVALRGFVVQIGPLGTFTRHPAVATSPVGGNSRFGLNPQSGELTAGLLQQGTKIGNRQAEFVGPEAIQAGVPGLFEGVPGAAEPALLKTSFIVLDLDAATELLQGTIQAVDSAQQRLLVTVEAVGDRCVDTAAAAIFLVSETEDGFSQLEASLQDLAAGMAATAFGVDDPGGCFAADVVLAAD